MLLSGDRELRDLHGASRAVAYLTLAGAPYVAVTGWLSHVGAASTAAIVAIALLMTATGLVCWHRAALLPGFFWYAAPVIATALISGLNLGTHDASTGAQLFYLWPVLYTANFLGRKAVYGILSLVYAGHAAVVYTVLGPGKGVADWVAMVLAMSMTTVVVRGLRARADRLRDVLEQQANADPLTGLANRRSFGDSLREAAAWARETGGSIALVTVDLDYFKAINDTYGHTEGDQALIVVADAMRTVTGTTGVAARLGGDEFFMLLRADQRGAVAAAEMLTAAVAAATGLPGGPPGLSIGVAVLPADADTVEELVAASDAALYEAKSSGRGRISVATGRQNLDDQASGSAALTSPRISRRSRG